MFDELSYSCQSATRTIAIQHQLQEYVFSKRLAINNSESITQSQRERIQNVTRLLTFSQTIVEALQHTEVQLLYCSNICL